MKQKLLFLIVMLFCITKSNAQSNWSLRGNSANDTDFVGTTNAKNLMFKSNNISSFKVKPNGRINFMYSVKIDSILDVDTIHTRVIRAGNNSITIGNTNLTGPDELKSSFGIFNFGSNATTGSYTAFSDVNFNIGFNSISTYDPNRSRLNVNGGASIGNTNTGILAPTNGLIVEGRTGIGASAPARKMEVYESSAVPQFRISSVLAPNPLQYTDFETTSSGNLRINPSNSRSGFNLSGTEPQNTVEIREGTTGNSGLRFTNLTNTITGAMPNSTDRVLSVDNLGNVIMVDDKQGTGTGTVTSGQNGLSTISGGTIIELGGNLLQNTTISSNAFNLVYTGTSSGANASGGNFGIGNLTATTTSALLHVSAPSAGNLFRITATDRDAFTHALTLETSGANSGTSTLSVIGRAGNGVIRAMKGSAGIEINSQVGAFNHPGIVQISGSDIALGRSDVAFNFYPTATAHLTNLGTAVRPWSDVHIMSRINQPFGSPNLRTLTINLGNSRDDVSTSSANGYAFVITTVPEPAAVGNGNDPDSYQNVGYMRVTNPANDNLFTIVGGGNVGIGQQATITGELLQVNGDVIATGHPTYSDVRLKKNISDFTKGLDIVRQLNVKSFTYNGKFGLSDTNEIKVGVMAQDIQQLIPEAVSSFMGRLNNPQDTTEAAQELYQVNYSSVLFTAINAIKELDSKNQLLDNQNQELVNQNQALAQTLEQQNQRIDEILLRLEQCCRESNEGNRSGQFMQGDSDNDAQIKSVKVELSNSDKIVLNQNEPNPFKDKTTIRYSIPNEVKQAEIIFFDNNGSVIKSILIETRGVGQLEVYSSNLSAGTYSYSLVADGISIDTKKMVNVK